MGVDIPEGFAPASGRAAVPVVNQVPTHASSETPQDGFILWESDASAEEEVSYSDESWSDREQSNDQVEIGSDAEKDRPHEQEEDEESESLDVDVLESGEGGYMTPPRHIRKTAEGLQSADKQKRADPWACEELDAARQSDVRIRGRQCMEGCDYTDSSDEWSACSNGEYYNESEQHS